MQMMKTKYQWWRTQDQIKGLQWKDRIGPRQEYSTTPLFVRY